MKEWTLYILRTTAEFFWFVLVLIAKALKWVGMKLWAGVKNITKKKKPNFSTADESSKLQMDAFKKRPEYVKRLTKVEADMGKHSAAFKVLYEEQQRLLQMINLADGGLGKPMTTNRGNGNNNNGNNNNNNKQKGNNNNGGNKQPAITSFTPTLTS